jgi:hypothetical protein
VPGECRVVARSGSQRRRWCDLRSTGFRSSASRRSIVGQFRVLASRLCEAAGAH